MKRWLYIAKIPELKNKLLLVLGLLIVYRLIASVPIPAIDVDRIKEFASSNQIFGLLDVFSGGGFSNFSLVALGLGPYITASIIMQLFTMVIPSLNRLYKEEGEQGRQIFNQYTRMLTVPLAIIQAMSTLTLLRSAGVIQEITSLQVITVIALMTAGTVGLMWLGEIITNQKVGNGISLIIFAGIISSLPTTLNQFRLNFNRADMPTYLLYLVIILAVIYAIIFITEGQRNIPISYSKKSRGSLVNSQVDTYLPMKVNQAGVMPIIFAVSLVLFPQVIANLLLQTNIEWVRNVATNINAFLSNQVAYASVYFVLVLIFTYVYTTIVFEPKAVAENLQKQGGFVTGIRPGEKTAQYLQYVSNRIIIFGAIFLGLVAVLPFIMTGFTGNQALAIGGTSMLIVVSVILETMKQIDSQIIVRDYDSL
jgi:preprotein translocase subunit SecY